MLCNFNISITQFLRNSFKISGKVYTHGIKQCLTHRSNQNQRIKKILIASWLSLTLYHRRDNFVEMIDVFFTFFPTDRGPIFAYSSHQLRSGHWLDPFSQIPFQLSPQILDRIDIRTLRRSLPPIDPLSFEEGSGSFRGVFWI